MPDTETAQPQQPQPMDPSPDAAAQAAAAAREAKADEIRQKAFLAATGQGGPKPEPAAPDGDDDDAHRGAESDSDDADDEPEAGEAVGHDGSDESDDGAGVGERRNDRVSVLAEMSEAQRERYVLAKRALKRDGVWDDSEIDALDPMKVIEKGEKRMKVQRDGDRLSQRFGELDRRMKALEGSKSRTRANDDDDEDLDLDGELEPPERSDDGDYLDDQLDDERDEKRARREPGEGRNRKNPDSEKLIRLQNTLIVERLTAAEQKIAREFPELKEPGMRDAVIARMSRMDPHAAAALESAGAVTDLMRDAALIVIGPKLAEQGRRAARSRADAAIKGQPNVNTAGDTSSRGSRKPDKDSIYRAAFKASTEPTVEESRKKFRRLISG